MNFENKLLKILLIFFISYFVLFGLYQSYLYYYNEVLQTVDPITQSIGAGAAYLLNLSGFDTTMVHPEGKPYEWLYIENEYATVVNEGCNGISVAILMVAFILAFHTSFKQTFLYILISVVLFYIINIIRVEALSYVYRFENERFKFAHDIVFPIIIYGFVLLDWLVWMKFFALKKNDDKTAD